MNKNNTRSLQLLVLILILGMGFPIQGFAATECGWALLFRYNIRKVLLLDGRTARVMGEDEKESLYVEVIKGSFAAVIRNQIARPERFWVKKNKYSIQVKEWVDPFVADNANRDRRKSIRAGLRFRIPDGRDGIVREVYLNGAVILDVIKNGEFKSAGPRPNYERLQFHGTELEPI